MTMTMTVGNRNSTTVDGVAKVDIQGSKNEKGAS